MRTIEDYNRAAELRLQAGQTPAAVYREADRQESSGFGVSADFTRAIAATMESLIRENRSKYLGAGVG